MNRDARLERIRKLVGDLCSKECAGRAPGTPQGEAARRHVVRAFEEIELPPAGTDGYLQAVPGCHGANVLAKLEGNGAHKDRTVLVSAHYDHLGHAATGLPYWGADDNAAAVAILIDTAASLARRAGELDRSVLFCAFDAEEPPFFLSSSMGSQYFVEHPVEPLSRIDMMICMDLMGHALGAPELPDDIRKGLFVLGAELSEGTGSLVDRTAARQRDIRPHRISSDVIPPMSDYHAFHEAGVPYLFLTCGRWQHYHQVTDTPEKLDYPKILAASDFLQDLACDLANRVEAPIRFLRDGRDDETAVANLLRMAQRLEPHAPRARGIRSMLEGLRAQLDSEGRLDPSVRDQLTLAVMVLESILQAS